MIAAASRPGPVPSWPRFVPAGLCLPRPQTPYISTHPLSASKLIMPLEDGDPNDDLFEAFQRALAEVLKTFTENNTTDDLDSKQKTRIETYRDLLLPNKKDEEKLSPRRRNFRSRVRRFVTAIYRKLGRDVFLICILAKSVSDMYSVAIDKNIVKIERWWKDQISPQRLQTTAATQYTKFAGWFRDMTSKDGIQFQGISCADSPSKHISRRAGIHRLTRIRRYSVHKLTSSIQIARV